MTLLTLITPTSGRPEAFTLLEDWIVRQTWIGNLQWIVATDTPDGYEFRDNQDVVRRPPVPGECGRSSQGRNLLAALERVEGDRILIVEDDDWYGPHYIARMMDALDRSELVGCAPSLYYNLRTLMWQDCRNHAHASLAQTGFRASVLPAFRRCIESTAKFIDMALWKHPTLQHTGSRALIRNNHLYVGMKGMPGTPGICNFHRQRQQGKRDSDDMATLRRWMGPHAQDADVYARVRAGMETTAA
jgi:hypothetical protein